MMTAPATYRNVSYRLSPGDRVTGKRRMGLRGACRFPWNAVKEAQEIPYSHACGREIEAPTFFALGHALEALRDCEPWLQEYSFSVLRYTLR